MLTSFFVSLIIHCFIIRLCNARPDPCIPTNVCTTRQMDASKDLITSSQQYQCDDDGQIFLYKYDVADCEGIPTETIPIHSEDDDKNFDLIQCDDNCTGYIHYREWRVHQNEPDGCDQKAKYGFKDSLVTYHCEKMEGNSQQLTCTDTSFRMKYYDSDTECKGKPLLNVRTKNGCQDVQFMFYGKLHLYRSFTEMFHCGYTYVDKEEDEFKDEL